MDPKTSFRLAVALVLVCVWFGFHNTSPANHVTPGKFGVLIVTDNSDLTGMNPKQISAIHSTICRDYLDAKCDTGKDETTGKERPDYRILDKKSALLQQDNKWSRVFKEHPPERYPWTYVSNGKQGTQGDVRLSAKEQADVYKNWGGQ